MLDLTERIQRYAEDLIEMYPDVTARDVMRPRPTRSRLRPILVAAAAAVIVLVVIGGLALLLNRTDRTFIEPATTTTTTLPATTATTPTTTTVAAPIVPTISWTRVDIPGVEGRGDPWDAGMSIVDGVIYVTGADWSDEGTIGDGLILRSEDGLTWERFDDLAVFDSALFDSTATTNIFGVASHEGVTVAVGLDCAGDESACLAAVWMSEDDGHTWERIPHQEAFGSAGLHRMHAVVATENGFIATGDDVWTSPDGRTWTLVQELPGLRNYMNSLVATPDLLVGVGARWDNGFEAAIWTSPDGTAWTRIPDENAGFSAGEGNVSNLNDVAYTSYGYVAVGAAGFRSNHAAVWVSATGTTWRRIDSRTFLIGQQGGMNGITEIGGVLVAVGDEGNPQGPTLETANNNGVVWISADGGSTWTRLDDPDHIFGNRYAGNTEIGSVAVFDGNLIAAGGSPEGTSVWIGTIED